MYLKNNQITVRELLSDPQARQLFQKEFPQWSHSPMLPMMQNMTLEGVDVYKRQTRRREQFRADRRVQNI